MKWGYIKSPTILNDFKQIKVDKSKQGERKSFKDFMTEYLYAAS